MSDEEEMSFEILESTSRPSMLGLSLTSSETPTVLNCVGEDKENNFVGDYVRDQQIMKKSTLGSSNAENNKDFALEILLNQRPLSGNSSLFLGTLDTEFPSLSSSQLTDKDFNKLKILVSEHSRLKENLIRANLKMKQYFGTVEKWQKDVQDQINNDRKRTDDLQRENRILREDLNATKHALEMKNDEIKSLTEEKDKIEENFTKFKEQSQNQAPKQGEMYTREQYKAVERQLSEIVAQNLQFKDMEENFTAQIQSLKNNLSSFSELLESCKVNLATEKKNSQAVQEQNEVLIHQAEVYRVDFETERKARENLAREKSDLLDEIKVLQNKISKNLMKDGKEATEEEKQFTCPSCYQLFPDKEIGTHAAYCQGISS